MNYRAFFLLAALALPASLAASCGGGAAGDSGSGGSGASVGATTMSATGTSTLSGLGGNLDHGSVQSLTVDPPSATITSNNGIAAMQQFTATAHYADGFSEATSASWSATNLAVGAIDGKGLFTATGAQGGQVKITAKSGMLSASANLTVKIYLKVNAANADPGTIALLQNASNPDPNVIWNYPYAKTVFPRGIGAPPLMWNGGSMQDTVYVHLTSATFELEAFATGLSSRYDLTQSTWDQFTNSTSGDAELFVSRAQNGSATLLVDEHWTIAPASMRGTIYYWAINTGRVMRIKPGASQPDDFLGGGVTCPSCHTVSAKGNALVMNEGGWPNETSITYDLQGNANVFSGYFSGGSGASQFALPAVSADGKVVVEDFAPLRGPIAQQTGALDAAMGNALGNSGLEGIQLWMPSFSPDDKLLAYVDSGGAKDLRAFDWDANAKMATNQRLIMAAGADPSKSYISFPTSSPDHAWIVYQRSNTMGSLGNASDLYTASVGQPGVEVALDALNGVSYPFAAGDRDRHWNYEPTFAPVAAGGYFWVVFHSRRTFGNILTGNAYNGEGSGTKQLWVAAFDQNPQAGQDPSHPAFHLEGQDTSTLNMRGYWALDPCKGDGAGCMSGTECCGGYCVQPPDGGLPTCLSTSFGCSNPGDHCDTAADCCDSGGGVQCINNVCSEPPPK